ncbi:glycerate kinase type-2 family protein [Rhizosaccharibacter radicis]|uniref:Glycerate kinase n=1 Tax=Rhizosaccharibacter radicis TaxID=2782605 RepID=A0ABT1VXE0_9PROT|nr:glycerate kinase [Acetobacteraceae bacterium KSS12]
MTIDDPAVLLRTLFDAAVAAADPRTVLAAHLPEPPRGRCVVVGGGKAAAAMAQAVEAAWPAVALSGAVAVPEGQTLFCRRIEVIEAAHPRPDERSERAGRRMLELVSGLGADDLVLALVSGGGSSLLSVPAPGLVLADKQALTRDLLRSGATIAEMNLVRRQLSAIKGGRLARAAAPARVETLLVSDIPGDDPGDIASGPTVDGRGNAAEALAILRRHRVEPPAAVRALLENAAAATSSPLSLPAPRLIATPMMSLRAAADAARARGVVPMVLGDALEGESRQLGLMLAGIARSVREHGAPLPAPCVLLSGGETTVTIGAGPAGRGGRNTEALLGFALAAPPGCWALMADTDGIDGDSDAAGAIASPDGLARAAALGLDARAILDGHDSYRLFDALDTLLRTGPTHTNVNDFRAVFVGEAPGASPIRGPQARRRLVS